MATAKIYDQKQKTIIEYYMDDRLKKNLDENIIPMLEKKDKDCVLVLDGKEGAGKSTLALQIGKYVDPTLTLKRVVFDAEGFREAIFNAKKGQCVVFDEAFTGLSSRSSLSGINRALVSLMMQMRQKNLMVIMVLPTFFLLDKYVALFRARALIHVYESGGRRGYFRVYNSNTKKMLYLTGKKDYTYTHKLAKTRFKGRFYGKFALGDEKVEDNYRLKKAKALEDTQKNPMSAGQTKYKEQRDLVVYLFRKNTNMTYEQMANLFDDYDFGVSFQQIAKICGKFGDKPYNLLKSDEKEEENPENEQMPS